MRTHYPVTLSLNRSANLPDNGQSGKVVDRHLSVRLPHTWGDSPVSRPLESDNQSRLEQKLFVTFNLASTQMNLPPASSSTIATKAAKDTGARIVEYMNANRQGQKT
jgi:hypothetical protein